jgi:hypothetical protein
MEAIRIGDLVAWADVPDGALVRSESSFVWWYLRRGEVGKVAGIQERGKSAAFWAWNDICGLACPWGGWSPDDHVVTIVAIDVPADASAVDLQRLAEMFVVQPRRTYIEGFGYLTNAECADLESDSGGRTT